MRKIIGSCGCVSCKGLNPITRTDWKSLTNKDGRIFGSHAKGHGVKQQHKK